MQALILILVFLQKVFGRLPIRFWVGLSLIISVSLPASAQDYPTPPPDFAHPGTPHYPLYSPYGGRLDRPLLIIYRQFTDVAPDPGMDSAWAAQRFFGPGFPNLQDYYLYNSFGILDLTPASETQGTVNDGIVVVNTNITADDFWAMSEGDERKTGLVGADPFVNFADFDSNLDGAVTDEELLVVQMHVARNATENCGATRWTSDVTLDGKQLRLRVAQGTEITNLLTHIHEVAHVALHTIDFYHYGVDAFDPMIGTCIPWDFFLSFNAYNKLHFGWIVPTVVNKDGFYEIQGTYQTGEAFILYDFDRGTEDYFVLENRQRNGSNEYDQSISDEGLVIWRIDEAVFEDPDPDIKMIELMRPSGGDAWDPSDPSTPERTMEADWRDGTPSGLAVRAIGPSGFAIRAYFDVRGPGVLVDPSTATGDPMAFEVVPGATSFITVPVMNTGELRDGFDYTIIGLPAGWYAPTYRLHSDPGVFETAVIDVAAPVDAAVGEYEVEAIGWSITDPTVSSRSPMTLTINQPGTLEVTPADGLLSYGEEGGPFTPPSERYTLRNTGSRPISWYVDYTGTWLYRTPSGGTLEPGETAEVTVSISTNANQLAPGHYSEIVSFTNYTNGNGNTSRPVRLTVDAVPGSLSVSPSDGFVSAGNQGRLFEPPYQTYNLSNVGISPFSWTATKSQSWVTLSATAGTLDGGQNVGVGVFINENAKSLTPGVYTDTVTFTNTTNGIGDTNRVVTLTVNAVGALSVSPDEAMASSGSAGGPFSPFSKVYTLTNTGSDSINWTATKYYNQPWLSISAAYGTLASGQSTTVTISMNSSAYDLDPGSYTDAVIFTNTTSHVGNTSRLVNLSVTGGVPGNLEVTPVEGITSSGNQGGPFTPTSQWYLLLNTGQSPLSWTATKNLNATWVSLTETSGTLAYNGANVVVGVIIDADANSLLPGSYLETIRFTNTTNGIGTTNRPVNLTVNPVLTPGTLSVLESDGFSSSGNQGGPFSPHSRQYTLINTGHTPISWTATKNFGRSWLSLTSTSGTLELNGQSQTITVFINEDADTLPASSYNEYLIFTNTTNGMGTAYRTVNLTVNPYPGRLLVIETDDYFSSGDEGGPFSPPYKAYTLVNPGGTSINWMAATSQPWVSLSETSGSLDFHEKVSLLVSINEGAGDLGPGVYNDMLTFTNTTNGEGNTSRALTLTVDCVPIGQPDLDCDGDVDGSDLKVLVEQLDLGSNIVSVEDFADNYGW